MAINYLSPAPFSPSPDAAVAAPVPPGPGLGTPAPGAPAPARPGAPPVRIPPALALAALLKGAPGARPEAPAGANGIPGAQGPGAAPYPQPMTPANIQYGNKTQQDGTVLLYVKNPDGSPGPVVHIIRPPSLKGKK